MNAIKLTQFSHGGGCGCKIAPDGFKKILDQAKPMGHFAGLPVGTEIRDDAAVRASTGTGDRRLGAVRSPHV
ncbi:MAG: hypothetical protein AB1593_12440 [Pseudomonadota bacterium]